jgi:hypothetical protein
MPDVSAGMGTTCVRRRCSRHPGMRSTYVIFGPNPGGRRRCSASSAAWFNQASPRVKSGQIRPDAISGPAALALMIADPPFRRPLMQVSDRCESIFDLSAVDEWISRSAINACARRCMDQKAIRQAERWSTFSWDVFSNHDH